MRREELILLIQIYTHSEDAPMATTATQTISVDFSILNGFSLMDGQQAGNEINASQNQ